MAATIDYTLISNLTIRLQFAYITHSARIRVALAIISRFWRMGEVGHGKLATIVCCALMIYVTCDERADGRTISAVSSKNPFRFLRTRNCRNMQEKRNHLGAIYKCRCQLLRCEHVVFRHGKIWNNVINCRGSLGTQKYASASTGNQSQFDINWHQITETPHRIRWSTQTDGTVSF